MSFFESLTPEKDEIILQKEKPKTHFTVHSTEKQRNQDLKTLEKSLLSCTTIKERVDTISKVEALPNLQKILEKGFGRKKSEHDEHGVFNFTIERDVTSVKDDETFLFGEYKVSGKKLKEQALSFKSYYLKELSNPDQISQNYSDKKNGRAWNKIFSKHWECAISEIDICYASDGKSLKSGPNKHKIHLATCVGLDVSANRLTGVHFGDFIRYIERKDDKSILYPENEKEKGKYDSKSLEIWKDSYPMWSKCFGYMDKYKLNKKLLKNDYKLMFGVLFTALQKEKVEVPIVSAIGCGVFGKAFEEYLKVVAEAYHEVLCENDFGFKAVLLSEIQPVNHGMFDLVFSSKAMKCPVITVRHDILEVARLVAQNFSTSVLNAGDLWEFGQFFEGGGSLEEYMARMTTGYFSQHFLMNPKVSDTKSYIQLESKDIGITFEDKYVENLSSYIKSLEQDFLQ